MKLCRYVQHGEAKLGVVVDGMILDIAAAHPGAPRDMIALIEAWDDWRAPLAALETQADGVPLVEADLLAPIARPGKILAMGLNYADHIAETGNEPPKNQVWFCKHLTSVNAPFAPIELPLVSTAIDYEAEMVAVIGRRGRHISKADAPAAIFGYCVGNDVSVRDWQRQTPQWVLGKSFDTHAPFGPWITTADEVGNPHTMGIRAIVNGEVRQNSNTRHLVFDTFDQIAHVSKAMTLEPGDIIYTGTPGGVGVAMSPPQFLKAGDRVRIEIDKLGAIEGVMTPEVVV